MNKVFKIAANTGLLMFFLGLLVVPIGSMGIVKVKTPSQGGVLSSKDATVNTEEDLEAQIRHLEKMLEEKDQELAEIEKSLFREAIEEGLQSISGSK